MVLTPKTGIFWFQHHKSLLLFFLSDLVLEDSEESSSENEGDPDSRSTTSFEDVSKLHPDLLLYRAAQARNLPVILQAVALGGNVNWHNEDEDGKTALIKAVESVSKAGLYQNPEIFPKLFFWSMFVSIKFAERLQIFSRLLVKSDMAPLP